MRTIRTLELARVGKWGVNSDEITAKDLADAIETFTPSRPVGIGHDAMHKDNAPKYGNVWSVGLADGGKTLTGEVEFSEELDKLYTSGKYDGWSVSLPRRAKDGKAYLHHLAFLGATPPKIPGLKEIDTFKFADDDKVNAFEFSGKLKEIDEEVKMDEEELKALKEKAEQLEKEVATLKAENEKLVEEKKGLEEKLKGCSTSEEALPKEFSDKLKTYDEELKKNRLNLFRAKVGAVVPKGVYEQAESLATSIAGRNVSVNFSDNGKTESANEIELLGSILSKWPSQVLEGSVGFDYSDKGETNQNRKESVTSSANRLLASM